MDDGDVAGPGIWTTHHRDHPLGALVARKRGRPISVCLPARDEAATIGSIVATVVAELVEAVPLVDEVLVVDDGSRDATAAVATGAGARVVPACPSPGAPSPGGHGKGQAMWQGLAEAEGDLVVFCDADVANFGAHYVTGLLGPLLADEGVGLVKGSYDRPLHGRSGEGGRVTELVARPLIATLFPGLAEVIQPLAGESAGRREVLERVPFAHGYGVELGLLVDVACGWGLGALAQVDLGVRAHRNRPLGELPAQALAVLQVALDRSGVEAGTRPATLTRPGRAPTVVTPGWCPPLVDVPAYRRRRAGGEQRL